MEVTGYMLREAHRRWQRRVEAAQQSFNDQLFAFPGETKDPLGWEARLWQAQQAVCQIQTLQQEYNQQVRLTVQGQEMSLALAVKLVSYAGARDSRWHSALTKTGKDRWSRDETTRSKDMEVAQKTLSQDDLLRLSDEAAKYASDLRAAMAEANGTRLNLDIPESLLS